MTTTAVMPTASSAQDIRLGCSFHSLRSWLTLCSPIVEWYCRSRYLIRNPHSLVSKPLKEKLIYVAPSDESLPGEPAARDKTMPNVESNG